MFNAPWPLPSGGGVNGSSGFWSSGIVNYELRAASLELAMRTRSSQLWLQLSNCIYRMLSALGTCSIIACSWRFQCLRRGVGVREVNGLRVVFQKGDGLRPN